MSRDRRVYGEAGFTLIELLLSMTVLGIILGSVTTALVVFLQTGTETSQRDDHTSGAATSASYLDRDLASADAAVVNGTSCSPVPARLELTWQEYTATAASPAPSPGDTYRSAYAIVPDPSSVSAGGGTRYKLVRWLCAPGQPVTTSALVLNLLSTSDFTASVTADGNCPGGRVAIVLKRYNADAGSDYTSSGCLRGRTR